MHLSDQGMKLIREGREEAASGRAEHMQTEIFAVGIEQLHFHYQMVLSILQ